MKLPSATLAFIVLHALMAIGLAQSYQHFEGRLTHPLALSPDGKRLFALNTPEARLCVFDVSNAANPEPVLVDEIPVGLEPVSLAARTNDEVWVVNEVGDSVSVVNVAQRMIVDTITASDEPADVVFAQGKAYVSCARNNLIRVFDAVSHVEMATIPLTGQYPRALAVNTAGTRLYAAFQLSGNHTTVLTSTVAPAQPTPTNTELPAAPKAALIVDASDLRVPYTVLDNDVAEIDIANLTGGVVVQYRSAVGTNLFDLAMRPGTDEVWVTNTDALNLTRFEPNLRGHFTDNRVTRWSLNAGSVAAYDLNPGINYALLPNPTAQATALAQPSSIVFDADGSVAWIAAFGSDRLAKISATDGSVLSRVDLRTGSASSRNMRGPRGLMLHPSLPRLFVLNKLSNTITTVNTNDLTIASEIPVGSYDPMPVAVKEGRGFLFDARLSGNGTMSCATCHLDADRDGLAWDLGNPGGEILLLTGYNNSIHDPVAKTRLVHPMKGAMTTQSLRGFISGQAFHWRGDKPDLQSFNPTFSDLMGGAQLSAADMDALAAYLMTMVNHPNPNRNLDRTLPPTLAGGSPTNGRDLYNTHTKSHCAVCHTLPTGSDNNIDLNNIVGSTQPVKTPHLRTVYQRANFNGAAGAVNVTGFGLLKDGTGFNLPIAHFYDLENLANQQEYTDIKSFMLCFDSGTAPTVGHCFTLKSSNATNTTLIAQLTTMEAQARLAGSSAACDLVARGRVAGRLGYYLYNKTTQLYRSDRVGDAEISRSALLALLGSGDALTFLGVLPSHGARFAGDRNTDTVLDSAESVPRLTVSTASNGVRLAWPNADLGWTLERNPDLYAPWQTATQPRTRTASELLLDDNTDAAPTRFYRLRRTW
jgi:DNA-binding beta-propeller fold protein YncE